MRMKATLSQKEYSEGLRIKLSTKNEMSKTARWVGVLNLADDDQGSPNNSSSRYSMDVGRKEH